ncbi:MAG: proton-conducting transporter membrane subunit [bacterium]|nr:proton-conducting transporter membrane subunit [bacterium]
MQSLAQLAPLIILFPAIGAFINFFWGARLPERISALIGIIASSLSFVIAFLLFTYLRNNDFQPLVIDPPLLADWIRIGSADLVISWQQRVDTLNVTMMLFVTFVGTLIHIYASGYMHGDPRFYRFFAYLNMFLTFMLILITGNNFLMMFVGWEGVGLCSYLLIGFWWDKPHGEGWKNSNAARKAFIANRIGDFGVLMAVFLTFWTFGTLDFYKPGELANNEAGQHHGEEAAHSEEGAAVAQGGEGEGEAAAEEEGHSVAIAAYHWSDESVEDRQLGVFGQAERFSYENRTVEFGSLSLSISTVLVLITLFMLLGAAGKSAQIPLFVWLPDAMAGPTPVSALIHAATMVTAGVYMMVRSNSFLYNATIDLGGDAFQLTSFVVTLVGISTALVGGFIAMGQFDIKRVLAYSTVSQLGFMVAAVGLGAYTAAMFHMITHAFFKALLFLGSGSVIHGMEHGHHHLEHAHGHGHGHDDHDAHGDETHGDHNPDVSPGGPTTPFDPQDMRNMGGLSRKMPITYITYLIGTLALAGIFPFAGFWSKDEILADAWIVGFIDNELKGFLALGVLLLAAGFTAFYMWRQIEMVFHGNPRHEAANFASESGSAMTTPLIILAFFSVFIGFINTPSGIPIFSGLFGEYNLGNFLEYSIQHFHLSEFQLLIALGALAIGLGGIFLARSIYGGTKALTRSGKDPLQVRPETAAVWSIANARMYWDEFYYRVFENPFNRIAKFLADVVDWNFLHDYFHDTVLYKGFNGVGKLLSRPFDLGIIDGAVNGVGWLVRQASGGLRRIQTGYVRTYAVMLLLGVVAVIVIMLLPYIRS